MSNHEHEIFGTIVGILFGIFSLCVAGIIIRYNTLPLWISVILVFLFCTVSAYELYRVGKYWYEIYKEKKDKKE